MKNNQQFFWGAKTYWGMSHGQPCNHCGFEKPFHFLSNNPSSLITQIASQKEKKKKKKKECESETHKRKEQNLEIENF